MDYLLEIHNEEELLRQINKPVIGWFCSYTPEEIIHAGGGHPFRVEGNYQIMAEADPHLQNFYCPFVRNCLGRAIRRDYEFLEGAVFTASCDAKRQLYKIWMKKEITPYTYLLDLPYIQSDNGMKQFKYYLEKFVSDFESVFKVPITDDRLNKSISLYNYSRRLLSELDSLRRRKESSVSARNLLTIIQNSFLFPREEFNRKLEDFVAGIRDADTDDNVTTRRKKRILLSGSVLPYPDLFELIEKYNGILAYEDLCSLNRYYETLVEETGDPLTSLARRYLGKTPCARMDNINKRTDLIISLVREHDINGVIFSGMKFCDTHQLYFPVLKDELDKAGIPVLSFSGEYTAGSQGQIQ